MVRFGVLALVLIIFAAACQPAPAATPTDLPTAIVTELPTGGEGDDEEPTAEVTQPADVTTAEATEVMDAATEEATEAATDEVALAPTTALTEEVTDEADVEMTAEIGLAPTMAVTEAATDEAGVEMTAEVTGEPASSTAVSAVTGPSTAEATADLAAMMPGDYCVEVTGMDGDPVVMRMNEATYTYSFEGPAGGESTTGAAPNVVPISTHTLTFQDNEGRYQFILTFSDQITLGTYTLGTTQMAELAGGPAPAETTDEADTGGSNASTGQNAPNTNTGQGGAGTGNAGAQATDEAGMAGTTGAGMGAPRSDQPVVLTAGVCADMMREAGMEVTAEPEMMDQATAEVGQMATAEATADAGMAETATPSGSAETVQPGSALATATEASATVVASGSDTEPDAEATSDTGDGSVLNTTPASPAEPSEIQGLTIIGARLEPVGDTTETSYIVLESGTLEFTRMQQQENTDVLSGAFMLTLSSAEDTTSSVTVQGFFLNLPVNQTPR